MIMKNIHVLPTDKPSYLFIIDKSKMFLPKPPYLSFSKFGGRVHKIEGSELYQPQHIYITSDEEIKEGDWVYYLHNSGLHKPSIHKVLKPNYSDYKPYSIHFTSGFGVQEDCKKIILTTDQELIKNGVQEIPDEFLEWFVKNPSCEWVELSLEETQYGNGIYEYVIYKKEIPKEEPKQDLEKEMFELEQELDIPSHLRWHNSKPKQETLTNDTDSHSWGFENFEVIKTEEDAKIFVETMENIPEPNGKLKRAFKDFSKQETLEEAAETKLYQTINKIIDGGKDLQKGYNVTRGQAVDYAFEIALKVCKWQQEKCEKDLDAHLDVAKTLWLQVVKENKKMYSEEEVHNILNSYKSFSSSGMKIPYFEWFEQFKK